MNSSLPVSSGIASVEFGFLSSEEIKALSVKRITNPTTFDTLLNPVPGGLYDAALGQFGDNACSTCNLKFGCPGHCGHLELPVHVYNPTFMDQCLRLLRSKCVYCHKLKMSRAEVNRFICKLTLVKYGLLKECYDIDDIHVAPMSKDVAAKAKNNDSDSEQDNDTKDIISRRNAFVRNAIKQAGFSRKRGDWEDAKIEAVANERRAIIKEFLYSITKGKKCGNCGGISPSYRKDRFVKIFKKPLSEKDKLAMIQGGFKAQDPLVLLKKRRDIEMAAARKEGLKQDEGIADMEDSPAESEGEGDDIEMLDIEHEVAGGNAVDEASTIRAKSGKKSGSDLGYLNAGQVHAALIQLFEQETDILSLVYSPRSKSRRGSPPERRHVLHQGPHCSSQQIPSRGQDRSRRDRRSPGELTL
ncbi:hypothetical protein AAFC00_001158 [Neodothiora populina]|uniref:DNA-directed RNA polymerase n=1 Tax=Neodothiora populina TaxID=2781224 RepID=A0ABR3PN01_9PEZI